ELLKVLLKMRCEQHGVAQKLVATSSELVEIAAGIDNVPALNGWRYNIFGSDARKLIEGTLALSVKGNAISVTEANSAKVTNT
ncbi:uncharacterized protein METZ01_LOCUS368242, partial [marine metagenome]